MKSGVSNHPLELAERKDEDKSGKKQRSNICSVSVVIPCFNNAATIGRALISVITQTQPPLEIIVVDDASTDDSLIVLHRWRDETPNVTIRIVTLPQNQGPATARNRGWEHSNGEYVAFLDADDYWLPQKIEYQYGFLQKNPNVALCGHTHFFTNDQIYFPDHLPLQAERISKHKLLISNPMVTPSVMVKADVPFHFRENRRHMEDHLLWMEIAFSGLQVVRLNIRLAVIGKASYGESGLSAQMWAMEKGDLQNYWHLRNNENISLLTAVLMTVLSLVKYLRRLLTVLLRRFSIR